MNNVKNELLLDYKEKFGVSMPEVIISVTSYPKRINSLATCLKSLLNQTFKPDKLILQLSLIQFPNKEKDLPLELVKLVSEGVTFCWEVGDLKSYKKLIPTLLEYPEAIIITFDDDVIYRTTIVEELIKSYIKHPTCISCGRSHQITLNSKGRVCPYLSWNSSLSPNVPSFNNFFTGIGGVLYPPHSLHQDVVKEDLFVQLAPCADDIWFWAMALNNNTKIVSIDNKYSKFSYIEGTQEDSLNSFNINQYGNDKQLGQVLDHYPQLLDKLENITQINFLKLQTILEENSEERILFWGASLFLEEFISEYGENYKNIVGIIDSNPSKKGSKYGDYEIYSPEDITTLKATKVILTIKNNHVMHYRNLKQNLLKNYEGISLVEDFFVNLAESKTSERLIPELYQNNAQDYILFLKHKFAYDYAAKHIKSTDSVLEIGCGAGYGSSLLAETGALIHAIDIDEDSIQDAKLKYQRDNIDFKVFDGINIDFEPASFDVIVSFQVIEHVEDVARYLENIKRLLKPNGKFFITTPSRTYRLTDEQLPWNPYHLREYDSQALANDVQKVFKSANVYSISSSKEILDIEYERVRKNRLDYYVEKSQKAPLILPSDFIERYSVADFYITQDDLNSGLDLLVSNIRLISQAFDSGKYWEYRYSTDGNSGKGSYGHLAEFKARVINNFVEENNINTCIEYGTGDGNQLSLLNIPKYIGYDVSKTIIKLLKNKYKNDETKSFKHIEEAISSGDKGELTMSLDVIYHLIEDSVFEAHIRNLFMTSTKYVIIYSSNKDELHCTHVRHRKFTDYVEKNYDNWELMSYIQNEYPSKVKGDDKTGCSFADFYIYRKKGI